MSKSKQTNRQPPALPRRARSLALIPLDFERSFIDGVKLKLIRTSFGLTQPEMISKLAVKDEALYPSSISEHERGKRELVDLLTIRTRFSGY